MKNVDFSECEFIQENMRYFTFDDFYEDRYIIKREFNKLSKNGKRFYLWYVFANIHMSLYKKNAIWDYINDYKDDKEILEVKNEVRWKN